MPTTLTNPGWYKSNTCEITRELTKKHSAKLTKGRAPTNVKRERDKDSGSV